MVENMQQIESTERAAAARTNEPEDLWRQMDRLFRDFQDSFRSALRTPATGIFSGAFVPALADVSDLGDRYEIVADLPGTAKDQLDVRAIGQTLHISAEAARATESPSSPREYLRHERTWSGFQRSIELPEPIRNDGIVARYADGVLQLTVPKANPIVEKRIPVQ
jgi:HSP20 family protein